MKLIDADTLVKEVCKISCNKDRNACPHINSCFETGCKTVIAIENAPAIEVEQVRHGHWILPSICYEDIECSVCHTYMPLPISFDYRPTYKYCPMCGACMDEVTK